MFQKVPNRKVVFALSGGLTVVLRHLKKKSYKNIKNLLIIAGLIPFLFTKPALAQVKVIVPQTMGVAESSQTTTDEATQKRIEELITQLGDERANVRRSAADDLGKIGEPALQAIVKALKDENRRIRLSAVEALHWIGGPQTVQPLIEALGDTQPSVRSFAARTLGVIGNPQAVQPLIKALRDRNSEVRLSAAEALGRIGDPQAVQYLIKALDDESQSVRRYAAGALRRMDDPQAVRALRKRALARKASDVLSVVVRLIRLIGLCCSILLVVGLFFVLKYKGQDTVTIRKEILVYLPLMIGAVLCPPILLVLGLILFLKYKGYNTETGRKALRAVLVYLVLLIGYRSCSYILVLLGLILTKYLALIGFYCLAATYGIYVYVRDIGGSQGLSWLIFWAYLAIFFLPVFLALYIKNTTVRKHCILTQAFLIILHIFFHLYLITYYNVPAKAFEMIMTELKCY